jgi:hypothetical protein
MPPPTMRTASTSEMMVTTGLSECERILTRLVGIVTACVCARVPAATAAGAKAGAIEEELTSGLATAEGPWATIAGARKPAAARARVAVPERRRRLFIRRNSHGCKVCGQMPV